MRTQLSLFCSGPVDKTGTHVEKGWGGAGQFQSEVAAPPSQPGLELPPETMDSPFLVLFEEQVSEWC